MNFCPCPGFICPATVWSVFSLRCGRCFSAFFPRSRFPLTWRQPGSPGFFFCCRQYFFHGFFFAPPPGFVLAAPWFSFPPPSFLWTIFFFYVSLRVPKRHANTFPVFPTENCFRFLYNPPARPTAYFRVFFFGLRVVSVSPSMVGLLDVVPGDVCCSCVFLFFSPPTAPLCQCHPWLSSFLGKIEMWFLDNARVSPLSLSFCCSFKHCFSDLALFLFALPFVMSFSPPRPFRFSAPLWFLGCPNPSNRWTAPHLFFPHNVCVFFRFWVWNPFDLSYSFFVWLSHRCFSTSLDPLFCFWNVVTFFACLGGCSFSAQTHTLSSLYF